MAAQTGPGAPTGARSRLRPLNEPLGALVLPFVLFGALTGAAIWLQLATGTGTGRALIAVHSYVGLVGLPLVLAKLAAGISAWVRRARGAGGGQPPAVHGATALLVLVVLAQYASGVAMHLNLTPGGSGPYKTVHLWSAVLGVPVVSYHLWRFLRRTRTTVARTVSTASAGAVGASRRHVLLAGGTAILAWGAVRVVGQAAQSSGGNQPNDFPVTLTSGGADQPDPARWRLRIEGAVDEPLTLSLPELRAGPVERHRYSLDCVLGWSVTRTWGGVPLRHLLQRAQPSGEFISVVVRSTTGYQVALLREQVDDPRTMVAWEVDGVDLTPEHGFPARIMAPGVIGELCLKWIDSVTVVRA